MTAEFTQQLTPPYRGRHYFIHGEPKTPGADPEEFAVTVYYKDSSTEETVEIARVDTAHGFTHFDQLYRKGQPKKEVEWGYWKAVEKLLENWRTYAQNYDDAHGE